MPKLWLSIFFGYNGSTFSGMQFQIQNHVLGVEDLLVDKLYGAGLLTTNNHSQLERQDRWSRAARTDKGVHALINGVSCLFVVDKKFYNQDGTLNRNKLDIEFKQIFQGTQIIYHCFKRVTARFQIRHMIRSRHYCYVCPKMLFLPELQKQTKMIEKINKEEQKSEDNQKINESVENQKVKLERKFEEKSVNSKISQEIETKMFEKISQCCKEFVGTHNFHNYSKNLRAKDAQAQRYILNFQASSINDDFLVFHIIGQSFIYHQIRKMIGSIIMIFANNYPASYVTNTFYRNQICMPLAPAQGLYLHSLDFSAYNIKRQIPQQLVFLDLKTVDNLNQSINDYICSQDYSVWQEWIVKLKQSIYHGIEYIEEEEDIQQGKIVNDE